MTESSRYSALYNGRFLGRRRSGVDRFAVELLGALAALEAGAGSLRFAVPGTVRADLPRALAGACVERSGGPRSGHLWEQWDLPRLARERPLVNLCNTAPAWRSNQLVVIHDAATVANPANYGRAFRAWYGWLLGSLMRRARVVATVSKFSADELTRHFGQRARGIEVIPESGEQILRVPADASVLGRLGLTGRRYVLALGSQSPNKNFGAVLKAMAQLGDDDLLLVAAGGSDPRVFAGARLDDPRLVHAGSVSDAELRALYEGAQCFVFPSFYEGFGLPPLEAMCCGCPVIVSRASAMPEACGNAALYCDPHDPATLAAHLRRVLGSAALRSELCAAGLEQAARYSWRTAALRFDEVLATLL